MGLVLCLHEVMAVLDECLHEEGYSQGGVAQLFRLHVLTANLYIVEHKAVPGEIGTYLQVQVAYRVSKRIQPVLPATRHLLLSGLQEVEHSRLVGEVCIDGHCLDQHSDCMCCPTVVATTNDGAEQCRLLVIVFSQQVAVGRREEGALEDAMFAAEGIHTGTVHMHAPRCQSVRILVAVKVGQQGREAVAAVELSCIPLLVGLKLGRLSQFVFFEGQLGHRDCLGCQFLALVGCPYVVHEHLQRRAVANDMVDVQEPIVVLVVAQHPHTEEMVVIEVERLDKAFYGSLDVCDMLNFQRPFLCVIDRLYRVAVFVHSYACQESWMGGYSSFYSRLEPVLVQTAVERI